MKRTKWLILTALLLLVPLTVEAQVIQYFMIPVQVVSYMRGPSYLKWRGNPTGLDVPWSCKDYGTVNNVMICAVDAETADLTWLSAQDGVYAWPTALDENLPQQERSAITAYLEAQFVPANWVSPSDTRRTALRTVTSMYIYMQRLTTIAGNPLDWGITLNTQFRNLTPAHQVALETAASSLGYTWEVVPNDTIRNILKTMADAWGDAEIHFGSFTTL